MKLSRKELIFVIKEEIFSLIKENPIPWQHRTSTEHQEQIVMFLKGTPKGKNMVKKHGELVNAHVYVPDEFMDPGEDVRYTLVFADGYKYVGPIDRDSYADDYSDPDEPQKNYDRPWK